MECRDTKLLIEAYWDRHLPPEMADRLTRHLHACPTCRAEYGPVTRLLAEPEPVTLPPGLRERICLAVEALPLPADGAPAKSRRLRRWQAVLQAPWAGALAACITFAFLGWLSSQIPGGGDLTVNPTPGPNASAEEPRPLLALGWVQSIAVPGPGSPLAALAHAVAVDSLIEPEIRSPAPLLGGRLRLSDLPATNSNPALADLPLVAGTLCAGYPH